jgi:arsenate reductase
MGATIFHNPRCSKSRAALALIEGRGHKPEVVEYLKTPPSAAALKRLLALLGKGPRELIRRNEAPYKALGLDDPKLSDAALIRAMAENPVLIERPIVVVEDKGKAKAVLGRPPEAVLEIL